MIDSAAAEALDILRVLGVRRVRLCEGCHHADAINRFLHLAVDDLGRRDAEDLVERRRDVVDVVKLGARGLVRLDTFGPGNDQRVARAAEVGGDIPGSSHSFSKPAISWRTRLTPTGYSAKPRRAMKFRPHERLGVDARPRSRIIIRASNNIRPRLWTPAGSPVAVAISISTAAATTAKYAAAATIRAVTCRNFDGLGHHVAHLDRHLFGVGVGHAQQQLPQITFAMSKCGVRHITLMVHQTNLASATSLVIWI
jgi:hypothetical protein